MQLTFWFICFSLLPTSLTSSSTSICGYSCQQQIPKPFIHLRPMCTPQPLSDEQRNAFVRDGFVIIPGAVPQKNVRQAMQFIQTAYENKQYNINGISKPGARKPAPGFYKPVQAAKEVMDLLYASNLYAAAEQILGKGHVKIRNNHGQIAYTAPSENFINQGMDIKEPHPKRRWHIDAGHGKYAAVGSDFSLLIGVCLSDGQYIDENRGQFNVWPGKLITAVNS